MGRGGGECTAQGGAPKRRERGGKEGGGKVEGMQPRDG